MHRDNQLFSGVNFNRFKEIVLLSLCCGEKHQQHKLLQLSKAPIICDYIGSHNMRRDQQKFLKLFKILTVICLIFTKQ